ncbi:unnamed protein product [Protopolystoma xenopodis]|uniref:Uncharacterized protein n=1 Tax=Protopolystoma xenopodis TaxID=117903 RepID=A0A448WCN6_9PLAT|nr:unnamed protein product [Protopolystoma xenopodis]
MSRRKKQSQAVAETDVNQFTPSPSPAPTTSSLSLSPAIDAWPINLFADHEDISGCSGHLSTITGIEESDEEDANQVSMSCVSIAQKVDSVGPCRGLTRTLNHSRLSIATLPGLLSGDGQILMESQSHNDKIPYMPENHSSVASPACFHPDYPRPDLTLELILDK